MTYLRFEATEDNRCWTVVAPVLSEEVIAEVKELRPGLHVITPNRTLSAEETQAIEVHVVYERRERRRAKRKAKSLEWLEALYALGEMRAA